MITATINKEFIKTQIDLFLKRRLAIDDLKTCLTSDDFSVYTSIRKNKFLAAWFCPVIAYIKGNTVLVVRYEYYARIKSIFEDVKLFFPESNYTIELLND